MNGIQLHRLDLNLLVVFEVLMDERNVTAAARRLCKTPSAISHALSRLREQTGDPLMVNVGGQMRPSPYALRLIEEVRPILQSVRRAIRPDDAFDPATSHRMFRVSMPTVSAFVTRAAVRVHAAAPDVGIDWVTFGERTYREVVEETIDLGMHSADTPLPEGLSEQAQRRLKRYVFARPGHPALANWTHQAWVDWPHVTVGMSHGAPETVSDRVARLGIERRIGARVTDFSGIAPLLAGTDMLSNQVAVMLGNDIDAFGLRILRPPLDLPDFRFRWFWNTRLSNDPGGRWFRTLLIDCFEELLDEAEATVDRHGVLEPVAKGSGQRP